MEDRYDRGPLLPYQISWRSGHIETIHAHQVLWPQGNSLLAETLGKSDRDERVLIHGEVDGKWQLLLAADAADILSIRRLTDSEVPQ